MESNEKITEYTTVRQQIDAPHIPWHAEWVSTALQCNDGLDARALLRFVTSPTVFSDDRRVLSWVDPEKSGYAYDECTALYGRLYRWLGRAQDAIAIGDILKHCIEQKGCLGRNGIGYAFDTSLAIDALSDPSQALLRVLEWLTAGVACAPITRPGWWSQSYGAHLLKCLPPLARYGRRQLALALADDLVDQCFHSGRFRIHADSDATYVHSHCYAMEGLLGLRSHAHVLEESADWLAKQVNAEGAIPAWIGAANDRFPGDIVAQTVRLLSAIDPERYGIEIARCLRRLAVLQDPRTGGIRYTSDSNHINTWTSAFALQAYRWSNMSPTDSELDWLI